MDIYGGAAVMDRNSTNFAISLYEKLKSYKFDSDYKYLFYYQYIVTKYINDIDIKSRGLLVYHTMGMGKSILAVALAMSMRDDYEPIVLLTKSLEANFRDSIVKFLKMAAKEGEYSQLGNMPHEDILAWIDRNFSFVSMNASNMITQITRATEARVEGNAQKRMEHQFANIIKLGSLDGKILIIDEAHNLFRAIINGSKNGVELYDMIMRAKNAKIIFLTGTPISNHPFELVPCFNMLVGTSSLPVLPENWEDFNKFFVDAPTNSIKNKEKFQNRIMGLVSYMTHTSNPGGASGLAVKKKTVEFPTELKTIIEYVPMEASQYVKYLMARDKELAETKGFARADTPNLQKPKSAFTSSYRVRSRQISNFAVPDVAQNTKDPVDVPLEHSDSPKFDAIRKNMESGVGTDLVYSQFIGVGGLIMFTRYLTHHGYSEYKLAGAKTRSKSKKVTAASPLPPLDSPESVQAMDEISELRDRATAIETPKGLVVEGSDDYEPNDWFEGGSDNDSSDDDSSDNDDSDDNNNTSPRGLIILAPAGTGKSHWIREHPGTDWVEGDDIYGDVKIHDYKAIDAINKQAKSEGKKIMTSTWYDINIIDAVVIPDLDELKEQLKGEERPGNDPKRAIQLIQKHIATGGPQVFHSIDDAVAALDDAATATGGAKNADKNVVKDADKNVVKDVAKNADKNADKNDTAAIKKAKVYALITGDVDPVDRNRILQIFNSDDNKYGGVISVLLISSTGAEGLDCKNIRRVHIMEPYWNYSRHAQIIARAVRNDSHLALPPKDKFVQPYIYLSVKPKTIGPMPDEVANVSQAGPTTDVELYEKSVANQKLIDEFTRAVQEVSIECMLNGESYCRVCSPTNLPLYSNNIILDLKATDPCVHAVEKTIKAAEVIVNGDKYFYKQSNSLYGYDVFVHDVDLNVFRKMREDNPLYQKIVKEIKLHAKKQTKK